MLHRNSEVGSHGTIENKGPSENQSCTRCGLIRMLGGHHTRMKKFTPQSSLLSPLLFYAAALTRSLVEISCDRPTNSTSSGCKPTVPAGKRTPPKRRSAFIFGSARTQPTIPRLLFRRSTFLLRLI